MAESPSLINAKSALCTKLSQLEKVVEYLNFHIEEHYFQIEELQKRYEKEEDRIAYDMQAEIESIYSGLGVERTDMVKKIDSDFKNQINDLKTNMNQMQKKAVDETKKSIKSITIELESCQGKLKRIIKS